MSQLKNEFKERLIVVILCAGEGKRLKNLTKNTPKPLLKIKMLGNETILQNTIYQLVKLGIEKIAIIIGHLGANIKDYISKLTKNDLSLQNKLILINSEEQYKYGPLFSFLSITKNQTVYNNNKYYLLIPGDTIFDYNLLKEVLWKMSDNFDLIRKHPFVFYRNIGLKQLKELYNLNRIISDAEITTLDSEIILMKISKLTVREVPHNHVLNQIIPLTIFSYDLVNEIINLNRKIPNKTVWEILNNLILEGIKVIAFNIENKYNFYDIDTVNDLKKLEKKRKGQ